MATGRSSTTAPESQTRASIGDLKTAAEEALGHAEGVWALTDLAVESVMDEVRCEEKRYFIIHIRECDIAAINIGQRLMREALEKASAALQSLLMAVP